jgi:hypothetical protein
MACSACAKRRKALLAKRKQKQAQGKPIQAATLGAVLAVTEAAGKVMGIHGEVGDEQRQGSSGLGTSANDVRGSQGDEPHR